MREEVCKGHERVQIDRDLLESYDWLLERSLPPSMLLDTSGKIRHLVGDCTEFLKMEGGRYSDYLSERLDSDLQPCAMRLLGRLQQGCKADVCEVAFNGRVKGWRKLHLRMEEVPHVASGVRHILLRFEEIGTLQLEHEKPLWVKTKYEQENTELPELERDYQSLLASLDTGVIFLDKDLLIRKFNPAISRIFRLELSDIGRPIQHVGYQLEGYKALVQDIQEVLRKGQPKSLEVQMRDGGWLWEKITPLSLGEADGIAGVVLSFTDITLQKTAQEKLEVALREAEDANRVKVNFLTVVSHEMRTPLNPIIGYVQLLREVLDHPEHREWIDLMYQSAKHLNKLIDDILEYSRLESAEVLLNIEAVDLSHLMRGLKPVFEEHARRTNIKFVWVGEEQYNPENESLWWVMADGQKLRTVLLNLLSNAFKFTHEGEVRYGMVSHQKDRQNLQVRFFVQDSGIGMSEEDLKHLFKPFSQLDRMLSRKYEGAGLGLAISHRLVESMKGTLVVSSQPDCGSEFMVEMTFPVCETLMEKVPPTDAKMLAKEQISADLPSRSLRILLVDRHTISCKMAVGICQRLGHPLVALNQPTDGLIEIRNAIVPFDLILLDLDLPAVEGSPIAKLIRMLEAEPGIRRHIIYGLSSSVAAPTRTPGDNSGFDGYMSKPLRLKDLKEVCDQVLAEG